VSSLTVVSVLLSVGLVASLKVDYCLLEWWVSV